MLLCPRPTPTPGKIKYDERQRKDIFYLFTFDDDDFNIIDGNQRVVGARVGVKIFKRFWVVKFRGAFR